MLVRSAILENQFGDKGDHRNSLQTFVHSSCPSDCCLVQLELKKQTFVRVFLFCHPSARLRSSSCCFDGQLLPVLSSEIEFALLYARGSETTHWPAL